MSLRGNLFIKIFLGFWLVTTAILGSWMVSTEYFESSPHGQARPPHTGPPHRFVLRTIYDLQNVDEAELQPLVQRIAKDNRIDIYLLDRDGADLFGRSVPDAVGALAGELDGQRRRASRRDPRAPMFANKLYRREFGLLRAVFVFPPLRKGLVSALGNSPLLRVALAVLVSGVICYLLSRLMTTRLKALQLASRRLAGGELDTRLQVRERGGDETDELARDFNSMAEQLQERIQAQRRLLQDVSHELRSPLARLRIALALAQEDGARSGEHLQRIEQEAERLEELIGQLLDAQDRDIRLDRHIDLVPLLDQLCQDAGFEGQASGKTVRFRHEEEQAVVATSGDLLHKSFENILRNAVSHTAVDTEVAVTLEPTDNGYRVVITDHGPGVPEDELQKIFDEFYRVDTARTRHSGGYGLGLAIANRAVQRHGGSMTAQNTGSGLAITVTLPTGT
jgi:two-component system sensor histidine kinase CpxA